MQGVEVGETFILSPQETIYVPGALMVITYEELIEDSLCPPFDLCNCQCVWLGQFIVSLKANDHAFELQDGTVSILEEEYRSHVIQLVGKVWEENVNLVGSSAIRPGPASIALRVYKK